MDKSSSIFKLFLPITFILLSFISQAQMVQLLNSFGKYQVRADACGTNGASCPITIEKPAGATTIYQAYIYYSSTAGQADPGANALTLSGGSVASAVVPITNLTSHASAATTMYTRYEDVTALLSPGLNAAAPSTNIVYTVSEASPTSIDGEGIIVVWNNPTILNSAVHISIGSRTTATLVADSIATAPINTLQPGFAATLGMGFAFSTGTSSQISTVRINGAVLDVNAGGWDDGSTLANGSLITLGGFGDSKTTNDDEYYDFASFIPNGSTQVKYDVLMTSNHVSDWLNAVYFEITGVYSTGFDTTYTLCQGDSMFLGGAFQNTGGVYFDTLTSHLNTDSVIRSTLIINPVVTIQTNDSICSGDSILLGGVYQSTPGIYYDTLSSYLGCDSIIAASLVIMPLPNLMTSIDTSICPEDSATISASGALTYLWNNGLGAGQSHIVSPTSTTTYVVEGTGANGCKNTASVTISIQNCDSILPSFLIIPNVFTPNGDGSNDVFTVISAHLKSIDCVIYNRWGQLLYSWDTLGGLWDGDDAPDGTYFYIINAEGLDGEEYHKTGTFSLIR